MIAVLACARFPKVKRNEGERAGSWETYGGLLRKPVVWLFFLSLFAYVGSEQGTANSISEFLAQCFWLCAKARLLGEAHHH
jgi:FHS family L-fucose permease-like MFS transporter